MMDSLWWGFILFYATEKNMACFTSVQQAHYPFRFEWLKGFVFCWFFGVFVVLTCIRRASARLRRAFWLCFLFLWWENNNKA